MKAFTHSSNFVSLVMNAVFAISSFSGIQLGAKLESADFLESTLLALDFVWLAVTTVITFVVSVLILHRIYSKYKLFLAHESKAVSFTMKSFLGYVGFGLSMGFVCAFVFRSFFMIAFWLMFNL
jgi:hypothetical protein